MTTSHTGVGVLNSLKNKMQHLRDELEKYKDLYEEKCVEMEEEKAKRSEVCGHYKINFLNFKHLPFSPLI